jgi:hypothetical protein
MVRAADLSGNWHIEVSFLVGQGRHALYIEIEEDGSAAAKSAGVSFKGRYRSAFGAQAIRGQLDGDQISFRVGMHHQHCGATYAFCGTVYTGETGPERLAGTVHLGEFWSADWQGWRKG